MSDEEDLSAKEEKYITGSPNDEILPIFKIGQRVRLKHDIKNDGTYPHARIGELLMKKGSEGYVTKIGDFLQTIRVYEIDFFELSQKFGCRESELEAVDFYDEDEEELKWIREYRAKKAKEKEEKEKEGKQ